MAINIQNDNTMFLLWVETVRKCFYLDFLCVRGSKNISCIRSHLHLVISKKLISGDECWSAVLWEWERWRNGVMCTISTQNIYRISTGYLYSTRWISTQLPSSVFRQLWMFESHHWAVAVVTESGKYPVKFFLFSMLSLSLRNKLCWREHCTEFCVSRASSLVLAQSRYFELCCETRKACGGVLGCAGLGWAGLGWRC